MLATVLGLLSQAANAAFSVEIYQGTTPITSLTEATALISGSPTFTDSPDVINYIDKNADKKGISALFLHEENRFPGDVLRRFSMRATATIEIDTAGVYTFGFDSDDGAELTIDGDVVVSDPSLHYRRTALGQSTLDVGRYDLELTYWENGGNGTIELFAALGAYTAGTFDVDDFALIGGPGGIPTIDTGSPVAATVPIPSSLVLFTGGLLGLVLKHRGARSAGSRRRGAGNHATHLARDAFPSASLTASQTIRPDRTFRPAASPSSFFNAASTPSSARRTT